ncbi:MAG TPA: hypothetical protein VMI75_32220 [Polyangiaceae bacterium]|nr:hypothetical protein [Polyangiaceae bacterium]
MTRCDCREHCRCRHHAGPAAYLVAREGVELAVCTACLWPDDRILRILAEPSELPRFEDYDSLGALLLRRRVRA